MKLLDREIEELFFMKNYPPQLFYNGNIELLNKPKISIVGSRKPTKYSRESIQKLAYLLSRGGVCIVSGGAMGIDATAHNGAGSSNTIAVLPCGIDLRYPAVNKNMLDEIEKNGLLLSQFEKGFCATPWSFVVRNELVVALGDILIVGEAEIDSGTMRSVEFALKMKKKIFVLPQRLGESSGTNMLLREKKAEAIYDIDEFVAKYSHSVSIKAQSSDDFRDFCATNPTYDEALTRYPQKIFEAELMGDIEIRGGRVFIL